MDDAPRGNAEWAPVSRLSAEQLRKPAAVGSECRAPAGEVLFSAQDASYDSSSFVAQDSDLSEVILRTFLARRANLLRRGAGRRPSRTDAGTTFPTGLLVRRAGRRCILKGERSGR